MYVASQVYGFASHVWFNLGHVLTVVAMRRPTASRGATLRAATVALLCGGIAKIGRRGHACRGPRDRQQNSYGEAHTVVHTLGGQPTARG